MIRIEVREYNHALIISNGGLIIFHVEHFRLLEEFDSEVESIVPLPSQILYFHVHKFYMNYMSELLSKKKSSIKNENT